MGAAIRPYAQAKAERVYIENFLRCKKSLLMQAAPAEYRTSAAKEMYAYGHSEYIALLDGLKAAVEVEETAKWALEKFKIETDVWRTLSANNRFIHDRV
jgi:hypothetical protein